MSDVRTILSTCTACRSSVQLRPSAFRLVRSGPGIFYGEYLCPACHAGNHRDLSPEQVVLLMAGGIVAEILDIPAEALESHKGPPIGYDDILDLMVQLEGAR